MILSSPSVPGNFLPPDDREPPLLADYELGGAALNDASQGLEVQVWVFESDGTTVTVRPEAAGAPVVLYTGAGITEVAGAFDSLMNPTIAFVEAGVTKLRWYDSSVGQYVVTTFPNMWSPRLTLDDKRPQSQASRDILLLYLSPQGELLQRIQRDRYGVEYSLRAPDARLVAIGRVGMGDGYRVLVELLTRCPIPPATVHEAAPLPAEAWGVCAGAPLPEWTP